MNANLLFLGRALAYILPVDLLRFCETLGEVAHGLPFPSEHFEEVIEILRDLIKREGRVYLFLLMNGIKDDDDLFGMRSKIEGFFLILFVK